MMSRALPSPTCPIRARWNSSLDGHAAFGNPTDPISAAAGQAMKSACKQLSIHCISSQSQEHNNMRTLLAKLSRRRFLGSTTLLGLVPTLFRKELVRGANPNAKKHPVTTDSPGNSVTNSNNTETQIIVWTSVTCHGAKMPCVNADGHPTFENPHGWTIRQMNEIYGKFLAPRNMAPNIKWMGLASYMKEGPFTKVLTRLEKQAHTK